VCCYVTNSFISKIFIISFLGKRHGAAFFWKGTLGMTDLAEVIRVMIPDYSDDLRRFLVSKT